MDLRVLFPADHRYGTIDFIKWTSGGVVAVSEESILVECHYVSEDDAVCVIWWSTSSCVVHRTRIWGPTILSMQSAVAIFLSDLAQSTAIDMCIEGDPHDSLV
jgi:hypothetical protein